MTAHRRSKALSAAARALAGFLLAVAFWFAFSAPYERLLAGAGEALLRLTESAAVTRLSAREGEIIVDRSDFSPAAPRPGLPAADIHFNLALLAALFALDRRPWEGPRVAALLEGCALLFVVHIAALCLEVRSLYATGLGPWSAAHYGVVARNVWSGAFHFYQIAGRFAAPFAIWWFLRRSEDPGDGASPRRKAKHPKS
jgi:hypothetical protein